MLSEYQLVLDLYFSISQLNYVDIWCLESCTFNNYFLKKENRNIIIFYKDFNILFSRSELSLKMYMIL